MPDQRIASAWFDRGNALCASRRIAEAVHWYHQALKIRPDFADAHYNLANAYKELDQIDKALVHYQKAVAVDASHAEAYNNMGTILLKEGLLERALACFRKAIALKPTYHQAAYNLGLTFQRLGRLDEAIECARTAAILQPDFGEALALLVPLLQQACDWPELANQVQALEQLTHRQLSCGQCPSEPPFLSFSRTPDPQRNFQVARAWSRRLVSKCSEGAAAFDFSDRLTMRNRLTIGYLSEQFRNAATAHLTAGMYKCHHRDQFRIIAYSCGPDDGSAYRRKITRDVDQFVDVRWLSDTAAAQRIYDDGVDILVDLMGWMQGHRMAVLARRPAPIQVNYLGYPGTTGAPFIDYILADAIVLPKEHHGYFSEKVVTLPHCYQVTDPDPFIFQDEIMRSSCGLPEKGVVFCSFNTDYKIEDQVFRCWMSILGAVPQSVLWLIVRCDTTRINLCKEARRCGIDPQRLVFADPLPKANHLKRLKLADLALDTFTVNGHTTTSDALWAGVPVISLQGTHFASRVAGSILNATGLSSLVTRSMEDYLQKAVGLALHPHRLSELKTRLDEYRHTQPLFAIERFVGHLEKAFFQMWEFFRNGLAPRAFSIEDRIGMR